MDLKHGQIFWKRLADFWALFTLTLFTLDFFTRHQFKASATAIAVIYVAILGTFAGQKEYFRWKNKYISKFFGEGFVILWTAVLAILIVIAFINQSYDLPDEMAIVYISVLTFFFVTWKSKTLKEQRLAKKR